MGATKELPEIVAGRAVPVKRAVPTTAELLVEVILRIDQLIVMVTSETGRGVWVVVGSTSWPLLVLLVEGAAVVASPVLLEMNLLGTAVMKKFSVTCDSVMVEMTSFSATLFSPMKKEGTIRAIRGC